MKKTIAIIGAGHMGSAIIQGLIRAKNGNKNCIIVVNPSLEKLNKITSQYGIQGYTDSRKAVQKADWIFIAVKPFVIGGVLQEIKDIVANKLLISVASGKTIKQLQQYVKNPKQKIIRIMPNIPVSVDEGIIGFLSNDTVSLVEKNACKHFLSQIGDVFEVNSEKEINYFSLIPGCGPALVSYFIEMFSKSAHTFNLNKSVSDKIAIQTFIGTLSYLKQTKQTPLALQDSVATKGGVTEKIIQTFNKKNLQKIFDESIHEGFKKIEEIQKSQD